MTSKNLFYKVINLRLERVRSLEKQQELLNILHSEDPDHYSRLWLVGFLKHVGYSIQEICAIIDQEASWGDYNARMTYCQVASIFKRSGVSTSFLNGFGDDATAAKPLLQKGFRERISKISIFEPKNCDMGGIHVVCYFRQCNSCPMEVVDK